MSLTCRVITLLKFYHKTETIPTDHHTTPTTPPPPKKKRFLLFQNNNSKMHKTDNIFTTQ